MTGRSKRLLKVFLCHATADKNAVRALCHRLIDDGVDVWLDEIKLLPGQDWEFEIPKAVRKSDVIIICLTRRSVSKEGYIRKEIKFALDALDEKLPGTIFLIPARLEPCEVPEELSRWQWVNLFEKRGYERLIIALHARAEKVGAFLEPKNKGMIFRITQPKSKRALPTQKVNKTKFEQNFPKPAILEKAPELIPPSEESKRESSSKQETRFVGIKKIFRKYLWLLLLIIIPAVLSFFALAVAENATILRFIQMALAKATPVSFFPTSVSTSRLIHTPTHTPTTRFFGTSVSTPIPTYTPFYTPADSGLYMMAGAYIEEGYSAGSVPLTLTFNGAGQIMPYSNISFLCDSNNIKNCSFSWEIYSVSGETFTLISTFTTQRFLYTFVTPGMYAVKFRVCDKGNNYWDPGQTNPICGDYSIGVTAR